MEPLTLEVYAGCQNTLSVPREMREYIGERAEGRTFNVDAVKVEQNIEPSRLVIEFHIIKSGAEQLEPFAVSLTLGGPASRQLANALTENLFPEVQR